MRNSRPQFPGALYHIYSRGNAKQTIFHNDSDRRYFLGLFSQAVGDHSWICHSYCLMGTHYHLLLETPGGRLSDGMQFLNGCYSIWFNKVHVKTGHVMQGRYHSILVKSDEYYLELMRYMALNPLKARLALHPARWRWSSFRALAGRAPCPDYLAMDLALETFSSNRQNAQQQYESFVLRRLEQALEASKGRPSLEDLFNDAGDKPVRNRKVTEAYFKYGYRRSEIGQHLGLTESSISRVISRSGHLKNREELRWNFSIDEFLNR